MLKGLSHTQHDFVVQALTGGNDVLLKDGNGIPSTMVRIPMFLMSDVIPGAPSTPHPMFIINGDVKSEIYVGKYLATLANGIPQSLHGRVPDNNISFADAIKSTAKKGDGWHVMTNAESAGLALLAKARGTLPRGNTNNGFSYSKSIESGILTPDAKNSTTGTKYDSGYLYDMYNVVSNGTTNNVYRCMSDKSMPLYDWTTVRTVKSVVTGKGQLAYILLQGTGNCILDIFSKDTKNATYTIPDATATCMVLDANDNVWIACTSGALYEVTSTGVSLVTTLFTTAETVGMSMCFDATGLLWISASNNASLYKFNLGTKAITVITGYAGITKIAYHPAGYIYASIASDKTVRRISLTDGSTVNTFTLTFTPRELVVDLAGNAYVAAVAGTSQSIAKIDVYLNQSYITINELDYVNNISVMVNNYLQLSGSNASGLVTVAVYNNDALWYKYNMGYASADSPITAIGNLFGDPNGLNQFKTFGISSDRYHLNQMFTFALGTVNGRMYPYNADTIHIVLNGDSTFTGTYNHIEFDISGTAFTKLYFNLTSTDINVKANDVNSGNLLADLATLTYSVTGDNITNTDGVVISNVVKSKLTITAGIPVSITATISKIKSYSNATVVTAVPTVASTFTVNNSKQLKVRLKNKNIVSDTDFAKASNYSTPTLMFDKSANTYMTSTTGEITPCIIKESPTLYRMWYGWCDTSGATRILYSTSSDGVNWSIPTLAIPIGSTYGGWMGSPFVLKESATSYKMWLSGYDGTTWRILYSASTDGGNTWTTPVLAVNVGINASATMHVRFGRVIKESDTSYKMWFSGTDSSAGVRIFYSTSTDGLTWSAASVAVNAGAGGYNITGGPNIIKESPTSYKMWYAGFDGTYYYTMYSTSTDGITWATPVPVQSKQTNLSIGCIYGHVIKESDTSYKMWFEGYDATYGSRLFYTTSTDGKAWSTPILSIGSPTSKYYTVSTYGANMINDNGTYKLWFSGYDGSNWRILYTTSTDMKTWTIPVLVQNIGGTYTTLNALTPFVIKESATSYKMWFCGINSSHGRILYSASTDGITWSTPVLAVDNVSTSAGWYTDNNGACVVKESATSYKMWFSSRYTTDSTSRLFYCTSSDGITWSTPLLVLTIAASTAYAYVIGDPHVIKENDSCYRLWFGGQSSSTSGAKLLYSSSPDGKNWSAPVLVMDKGTSVYNQSYVVDASIIKNNDGSYTMVTSGHDGTNYRLLVNTINARTAFGDTTEAYIDGSEMTSMTPSLLKDTTADVTLPALCCTHGTYSIIAETSGFSHPAIIKESNTLYKMWAGYLAATPATSGLMYQTSLDGKNWTGTPTKLTFGDSATVWHNYPSVHKKNDGTYEMWVCGGTIGTDTTSVSVYYCTSTDGITWTTPVKIISLPSGYTGIEGVKVLKEFGKYKLWATAFTGTAYTTAVYSTLYAESSDGQTWSTFIPVVISGNGFQTFGAGLYVKPIRTVDGKYIGICGASTTAIANTCAYIAQSADGINWTIPSLLLNYNNTAYDTNRLIPSDSIIDGNTLKMWFIGSNGTYMSLLYAERQLDQIVTNDMGDTVLRTKRHLRVPKYSFGVGNTVLNHDIIKYNGTYYLFYTKNTGSGYKIQMTTSTDMRTWTTAVDIALPGVDSTYAYGCSSPTVIRTSTAFKVYFQVFDSGYTGSVIYMTSSPDGITWNAATKVIGINAVADCAKFVAKPSIMLDGSTYKMWFLGHDGTNMTIQYSTSTDGTTWANSTRVLSLGAVGSARLFDGTMYISCYKKALSSGYRMFYNTGSSHMYVDSTDGTTIGTPAVSYKYPMDIFSYGGVSSFKVLQDDFDTKMVFLGFDANGTGYILYREYNEGSTDFAEATDVSTRVVGDSWHDQKFLTKNGDCAKDPCIIKVGNCSYMGWFTYTTASGTGSTVYMATSTDGINWTNFTKCWDTSTKSDALLTTFARKLSVIKDGSTYKMWISTNPTSTSAGYQIVYMTSTDGINWSTATATTLGDGTANTAASIIKDGSTYKAWVFTIGSATGAIDYYESTDGITWTVSKASTVKPADISAATVSLFINNVYKIGIEYVMYATANTSGTQTVYRAKSTDGKAWVGFTVVTVPNYSSYGNKSTADRMFVLQENSKTIGIYSVSPNMNIGCAEYCAIYSEDGITFGKTHSSYATINAVTVTKASNNASINSADFETVTRTGFYNFNVGDKFRIDYKGSKEVVFTANATKVKLEACGASGADETTSYTGGKGGYVYGSLDTSTRKKLVAVIGSIGGYNKDSYGYNGGGTVLDSTGKYYHGGGATDIRTSSNDLYRRLLVAGGGGSADASDGTSSSGHSGGNGGGWTGTDGVGTNIGKGGTQTAGGNTTLSNLTGWSSGIFGSGAKDTITTTDVATLYGAGGGGYYGAGNGSQGAGGGSSYVAGNANCPTAHPDSIALTDSGTSSGTNTGNGYAVITVLKIDGSDGSKRTYNGSGPLTWNDTGDITGIADLVGNLNAMVTGLKVVNKTFYVIKDNDAAMSSKDLSSTSADWKMIDATGNYIASGTGIALNYSADFSATDFSALALTATPYLAKALGIAPVDATTGLGWVNGGIASEYFPIRGGYYGSGNTAGIFNLSLVSKYTDAMPYTGFRIAYYKP